MSKYGKLRVIDGPYFFYSVNNKLIFFDAFFRCILWHNLTEIIFIGSKYKLMSFNSENITVEVLKIQLSDHVKNLGFIFDSKMNLNKQINNVCKLSFFQLTKIS